MSDDKYIDSDKKTVCDEVTTENISGTIVEPLSLISKEEVEVHTTPA